MTDNSNFETYLFISSKKLVISVHDNSNFEKIYSNYIELEKDTKKIDFEIINNFLNDNIFKIEKILENFIEKIFLIIDSIDFFAVHVSIKKKNHDNLINSKDLNYLLNEAKLNCKKTIAERKIVHMFIENYKIDNSYYSNLPKDLICKSFSLDISFLCLPNDLIQNLENILKNFQISVTKIISANYVNSFFDGDQDIFYMAKKIIDGYNENEVIFVEKTNKRQGFFEKFFNFFS